jgi:hypothetical protein
MLFVKPQMVDAAANAVNVRYKAELEGASWSTPTIYAELRSAIVLEKCGKNT